MLSFLTLKSKEECYEGRLVEIIFNELKNTTDLLIEKKPKK